MNAFVHLEPPLHFRGEIWLDNGTMELYDFKAPSKKNAIEFLEECRKTNLKERKGAKGLAVVLRRMYWFIPWFACYVSLNGKELTNKKVIKK